MVWKSNKYNLMKNVHIHFINIDFGIVFIVVQIIISVSKHEKDYSKGEKSMFKGHM